MFGFSLNSELCKLFTSFVFLSMVSINFIEMKSLNNSLLRHRRSYDEYKSITDPDMLSKQYALVNQFRGVDILGDIRQYKNGKIDDRDFGQNVHFNYRGLPEDRILPGEKERAVKELQQQGEKIAMRLFQRILEEWLGKD